MADALVDPASILATRLREAREALGISQAAVGRLMGLSPKVAAPRINHYENGRAAPNARDIQALAKALGVPAAFLVTGDPALARLLFNWLEADEGDRDRAAEIVEASAAASGRPRREEVRKAAEALPPVPRPKKAVQKTAPAKKVRGAASRARKSR